VGAGAGGLQPETLKPRLPKLPEWEAGARASTFKQAEAIAARIGRCRRLSVPLRAPGASAPGLVGTEARLRPASSGSVGSSFSGGFWTRSGFPATQFEAAWQDKISRLRSPRQAAGAAGDFYRTTLSRVGRRFARALVVSTLEGRTLYRDAYRMLGTTKGATFRVIGRQVGVIG